MIINFYYIKVFIFILFIILFPFVQKQWLNLSVLELSKTSFYSILYFLSGFICPIILSVYSLKNFSNYKFHLIDTNYNKFIRGKSLLIFVVLILLILSTSVANYFYITFEIIYKFLINSNYVFNIDLPSKSIFIFIITVSLIFNKTKKFLKQIILFNFFLLSSLIWFSHLKGNVFNENLLINKNFIFQNILNVHNPNFINILLLLFIEAIYFVWAYLSNKNNLSDWNVPLPLKGDMNPVLEITLLHVIFIAYYSFLE